jgi:hypothetical protein
MWLFLERWFVVWCSVNGRPLRPSFLMVVMVMIVVYTATLKLFFLLLRFILIVQLYTLD